MAALYNRADHYTFIMWFLLCFFSFLTYSQPSQIKCLPYFHAWWGLSANLECRSEMCCTPLAENTGRKKSPKIRHRRTIARICQTISSYLRHISTVGKKMLNSTISSTCSHNFDPIAAEIGLPVWSTPANFNGFRVLASLLHRRRSTEVNHTLHDV